MFDLRYHVASLAAVFLALIIGILVGVGISGHGFVSDSERSLRTSGSAISTAGWTRRRSAAPSSPRHSAAAQTFVSDAYPALMDRRLAGLRVAVVFAGPVDNRVRGLIEKTLDDAGGNAPAAGPRTEASRRPADAAP